MHQAEIYSREVLIEDRLWTSTMIDKLLGKEAHFPKEQIDAAEKRPEFMEVIPCDSDFLFSFGNTKGYFTNEGLANAVGVFTVDISELKRGRGWGFGYAPQRWILRLRDAPWGNQDLYEPVKNAISSVIHNDRRFYMNDIEIFLRQCGDLKIDKRLFPVFARRFIREFPKHRERVCIRDTNAEKKIRRLNMERDADFLKVWEAEAQRKAEHEAREAATNRLVAELERRAAEIKRRANERNRQDEKTIRRYEEAALSLYGSPIPRRSAG